MKGFFSRFTKPKNTKKNSKKYLEQKEIARKIILDRISHYSPICDVSFNRVAIRNQKSRWGSCSSKRNLNFSYRLVFLPKHICDYVVVHELCHLKQMNHGPLFWLEVRKVLPDYEICINELRHIERRLALEKLDLQHLCSNSYFSELVSQKQVVN
jgi:hypothetical protein